ncbi:hypothetical protein ACH5RR_041525 [Cinchona calisaya]|uniref:CASP-like protein n=1 Tax=Cinchona calisaya TaxID=153742 RepID=A0ABD2XUI2_9GENT
MANASPLASNSSAQPPLPTPSPFSYSVASATWSSRSPIEVSNLVLRSLALLLSFASALTLAAPSSKKNTSGEDSSFQDYKALMYCFIVDISVFLYTAYQLFKGICDIAYRGIFISEMISDYINFIFDQGRKGITVTNPTSEEDLDFHSYCASGGYTSNSCLAASFDQISSPPAAAMILEENENLKIENAQPTSPRATASDQIV